MVHSAIRKTPYEIHRGVRPRNAPEFTDNHAAELLTTYIGGPARTILSDATSEAPADLARFILEDERILMSSWAASNRTLLPSIEVVSTMVATQKEEDGYETPEEPVESDDILSARKTPILSPKRPLDSETPTRVLRPRKNSKP